MYFDIHHITEWLPYSHNMVLPRLRHANKHQISSNVLHNLASQVNVSCFKVCLDIFTEKQDKWMINKMIYLSVKTLYHEEFLQMKGSWSGTAFLSDIMVGEC